MRPLPCLLWMYDEHDFASEGRGREITRGTRLKKELELLSYVCSLAFVTALLRMLVKEEFELSGSSLHRSKR